MYIAISKSMLQAEVNRISELTSLSRSRIKEILVQALCPLSIKNYIKAATKGYTGLRSGSQWVDIESLNFPELFELNDRILYDFNCNLHSNERLTDLLFIKRVADAKCKTYRDGDNRYIMSSLLLLAPYLFGYHDKAPADLDMREVSDWHVKSYADSLIQRYYIRFTIESIDEPYHGNEKACRKDYAKKLLSREYCAVEALQRAQFEILANKANFTSINCAETNILKAVAADISKGQSGEGLEAAIRSLLDADFQQLGLTALQSHEIPTLAPEDTVRKDNNIKLNKNSYSSVSPYYPINLNVHSNSFSQLTRGDLQSGLRIYGGHPNIAEVVSGLLMGQLVSQGGGLLILGDHNDRISNRIYQAAKVFGRETDYFRLDVEAAYALTQAQFNWALANNKIVQIEETALESPELINRLTSFIENSEQADTSDVTVPPFTVCWSSGNFIQSAHLNHKGSISTSFLDALTGFELVSRKRGFGRILIDGKKLSGFRFNSLYLDLGTQLPYELTICMEAPPMHVPFIQAYINDVGQFMAGNYVLALGDTIVSSRVGVIGYFEPEAAVTQKLNVFPYRESA